MSWQAWSADYEGISTGGLKFLHKSKLRALEPDMIKRFQILLQDGGRLIQWCRTYTNGVDVVEAFHTECVKTDGRLNVDWHYVKLPSGSDVRPDDFHFVNIDAHIQEDLCLLFNSCDTIYCNGHLCNRENVMCWCQQV